MSAYAELHCLSNFSFLRGASHADELVARAKALEYAALAITDECSMAGMVRAHDEAKKVGLPLMVGAEFHVEQGPNLVLLAQDHDGYSHLCGMITRARRRSVKGRYRLLRDDVGNAPGCCVLWIADAASPTEARWVRDTFEHAWIAVELHRDGDDAAKLARLTGLGKRFGLPLVAAGDVHMHARERRALQDTLTAIRHGVPVTECGHRLFANGERHLRPLSTLQRLYPPELLAETVAIAQRCRFNLDELKYDYPHELVPAGETPASHLRKLTEIGLKRRWPQGETAYARKLVEKELALIQELGYEYFFLTVEDLVAKARSLGILCQGRGSAANSAVCYALGITEVKPDEASTKLLVERFISKERNEPPDIDVDFEHQRREEIIQYVYDKYGRERAAIAATVITYRIRSAVRDVGKALGFTAPEIDRLSKSLAWWDDLEALPQRLREQSFDPESPRIRTLLALVGQILGFPRHLSQHVGGFVISDQPLAHLVPIENAAMPDRTIIQWDKDDLESLGLLKVDVLALGMLSALRRSLAMVSDWEGRPFGMQEVPREDAQTYAMVQRAETIGVFQIESRAQMSMLPRLKPQNFYDLVIQIAIVRPGPIQGDMVHPYLRRRNGQEQAEYPSEDLRKVLQRTLGVPLFQEQVMEIAMVAAGFSAGDADQMRRSMAAWKRGGGFEHLKVKLFDGMRERGYTEEFAQSIFHMIQGFASYGFPESHSASFALLAYVSAWLKCHQPAAFFAGLLNSQPMGFYPPTMLVTEARRVGVEVRPVDVGVSGWDCVLEGADGPPAIRLGFNLVSGFNEAAATRIATARSERVFAHAADLARRAQLNKRELDLLAKADALRSLSGHRHAARWAALAHERPAEVLADAPRPEAAIVLPAPSEGEEILADYRSLKLSLRRHPVALLRERLDRLGVVRNADVRRLDDKRRVAVAGIVMFRQRPETAKGVTFMTLEDETGIVNLVVWAKVLDAQRSAALGGNFLVVSGELQKQEDVIHVVARRFHDHTRWIGELPYLSRDFR